MKKRSVIFFLILVLILVSVNISRSTEDVFGEDGVTNTDNNAGKTVETLDAAVTANPDIAVTPAQEATDTDPATPLTYDVSETTTDLTVTEIPNDVAIETTQGTISSFSMTNALFSLGSLIQGSFISFTNNNNIYINSLFDASTFTATLDNGSSLEVGQRSSFGDMGKVVVQIDGTGNLTQDNSIIFVPQGNDPEYIYYNTTQIEFQDGDLYLLGESISNKDGTQSTTTAFFDENGFTKIELPPGNVYSIFDYSIANTGDQDRIICKKNPLCDINIDESTFTVKGKVNFSLQAEISYTSYDENNIFTIDTATGIASLENRKPSRDRLSDMFVGHFRITETSTGLYYTPQKDSILSPIKIYTSINQNSTLTITQDSIIAEAYTAFTNENNAGRSCYEDTTSYC